MSKKKRKTRPKPKLTKVHIADEISRVLIVPREMSLEIVDAVFDSMIEHLNKGKDKDVFVPGFGRWRWKKRLIDTTDHPHPHLRKFGKHTVYACKFHTSPKLLELLNPDENFAPTKTYNYRMEWNKKWRETEFGKKYMREYKKQWYLKKKEKLKALRKSVVKNDPKRKRWE